MKLSHRHVAPSGARFEDTAILEGWMRGTYLVAGIFAIRSESLTVSRIQENIPEMYAVTKAARRKRWPRGISGTFLFPFYLGEGFSSETIDWVQRRRPYRWAIWHEPVLYDIPSNSIWMRSDYGHFGSAFHPLVSKLYGRAFEQIGERLDLRRPDFINGNPVKEF